MTAHDSELTSAAARELAAVTRKRIEYEANQPTTDISFGAYCFIVGLQEIVTKQQQLIDYLLKHDSEREGDGE